MNAFTVPHRTPPSPSAPLVINIEMPRQFAPAFKSAIEDISNIVGQRLEGAQKFSKEDALTRAASALGLARAAITKVIPKGDRDYA